MPSISVSLSLSLSLSHTHIYLFSVRFLSFRRFAHMHTTLKRQQGVQVLHHCFEDYTGGVVVIVNVGVVVVDFAIDPYP
jgi:hypothetical protein